MKADQKNRKNIAKNRVRVRRSESQEPRVFCEVSLGDFMMPKKRLSKLSFSVYDDFVIFCSRCYIFYALHFCTSIFDFFAGQGPGPPQNNGRLLMSSRPRVL